MRAKCALIQQHFGSDRATNVEHGADLVRRAAADGAEIICLPELATHNYFCEVANPDYFEFAEAIPGPSTRVMQAAARDASAYVIFPLYERDLSDGQLYNTAVVIDRNGEIAGKYRKNMIPLTATGPHVPGANEKYYFRPGNLGYPVFPTDLGITIGITICYDRHFPEGVRSLALAGADVIFAPVATGSGRSIWELELQGHAIANLLWVGGVNRVGAKRVKARVMRNSMARLASCRRQAMWLRRQAVPTRRSSIGRSTRPSRSRSAMSGVSSAIAAQKPTAPSPRPEQSPLR